MDLPVCITVLGTVVKEVHESLQEVSQTQLKLPMNVGQSGKVVMCSNKMCVILSKRGNLLGK